MRISSDHIDRLATILSFKELRPTLYLLRGGSRLAGLTKDTVITYQQPQTFVCRTFCRDNIFVSSTGVVELAMCMYQDHFQTFCSKSLLEDRLSKYQVCVKINVIFICKCSCSELSVIISSLKSQTVTVSLNTKF